MDREIREKSVGNCHTGHFLTLFNLKNKHQVGVNIDLPMHTSFSDPLEKVSRYVKRESLFVVDLFRLYLAQFEISKKLLMMHITLGVKF